MITKKEFNNLKKGDRVKTFYSGEAIVINDKRKGSKMIELNCIKKTWSCPFFYRSEIECKLNG